MIISVTFLRFEFKKFGIHTVFKVLLNYTAKKMNHQPNNVTLNLEILTLFSSLKIFDFTHRFERISFLRGK